MSNIPNDLKYTESHEWIKLEGDNIVTIGITDHAQHLLGDLVYVELPEVKDAVKKGSESGVVESVKAASDVYSPVSGTVLEINEALASEPGLVNTDPYGEGWLFKVKLSQVAELEDLLDSGEYTEVIEKEEA